MQRGERASRAECWSRRTSDEGMESAGTCVVKRDQLSSRIENGGASIKEYYFIVSDDGGRCYCAPTTIICVG